MSNDPTELDHRVQAVTARLEACKRWVSLDGRINESDAAELVGVSQRTLRAWREEGRGPVFVLVGRRLTFRIADLLRWLDERTHNPSAANGNSRKDAERAA